MVRFVGNSGVHLYLTDENTGLVRQDVYFGMPEKLMFDYDTSRVAACPRIENALAHPEYRLVYDDQHIDENRIDHSEYYHLSCCLSPLYDDLSWLSPLQIPASTSDPGFDEAARMAALAAGAGMATESQVWSEIPHS
jgi:hypothetical protein